MTSRRIKHLLRHFPQVKQQPVLDVGCADGVHLYDFGRGSIGLDGRDFQAREGYSIIRWNFESDIRETLEERALPGRFKYVWCSDVFEHVLSPHQFLLNFRRVLDDDGLLFLGVPLTNPLGIQSLATRGNFINFFCGFLSQDHVNFFTFQTLRHTIAYAGFELVAWYSPFLPIFRRPLMCGLEPVTVMALRKVKDFQYGPKAYKSLDEEGRLRWKEIVFGN
jgi:2-polyprenyl-3-methyl-5-hydroxy-6-metoxy-1,4-benzoquinol methylase